MRILLSAIGFILLLTSVPHTASAQYGGSCETWRRECARLHGYGTPNWNACMGQPGARRDCGRGGYGRGYGRGAGYASCQTWQRECARLHGYGSYNWNACMGQPGARRACR